MKTTKLNRALAAALICGLSAGAIALTPTPAFAQGTPATKPAPDKAGEKKVIIVFKTGSRVEAILLSETDDSVHVKVTVAGITSTTDYRKSDILKIEPVDAPKPESPKAPAPAAESPKPDTKPEASKPDTKPADDQPKTDTPPADGDLSGLVEEQGLSWGDQSWRITSRAVPSEANGPKVYMVYMGGEFGRNVAFNPMKDVIADVKKYQPDVLIYFYDHTYITQIKGEKGEVPDFFNNPDNAGYSFSELETARAIGTLMFDQIRDDPTWTKKPRMVSWIRKAMGGAAFLPFVAPEIYYTPDGLQGGIGYIEHMFDGRGDERTREKQYSLRQARAEGLAEMGGYDKLILRAMARADFVMSYKMVDGQVVLLPDKMPESPDEILLTDDGKDKNADATADIMRGHGNDVLTLDATLAQRLGVSKGTAETIDDLMDRMGLPRNYVLIKGKGNSILREWSKQVADAERNINRLARQFADTRVKEPGDYTARTRFRGERIQLIKKIRALYQKYEGSLSPAELTPYAIQILRGGATMLQDLEAQQLIDKPERR